ncbi:MAG: TRAP transporter substrate-binding protein [Gammaproteobacteria bacterium]|nr:TRAP transporter substrate-binding protein [Gammaproteobacteria bacterium]
MKRRNVLAGAGLAAVTPFSLPAPAIAKSARRLTMVTDWPEGPGVLPSARRFAQIVDDASGGGIRIEVTSSGEVVRPFETFDAVQSGVADMFHSHIGYFDGKSPAFHLYSGVPFGFTANEMFAWVRFGGGQALWDELCGQFNVKPLLCSSTGAQMGGWFRNELTSTEELKGLRYRMAEPGAEVFRRLGATVVVLPGADIVQSLRSGAIDACEWLGPWLDTRMGLHEVAGFYYYPAWHEPGTALALGINRRLWDSLDDSERRIIETAAASEYTVSLAEFNANNAAALRRLQDDGTVQIRRFDDAILKAFAEISADVVAEAGAGDDLSRRIYRSYFDFLAMIREWSDISEGAYLDIRRFS